MIMYLGKHRKNRSQHLVSTFNMLHKHIKLTYPINVLTPLLKYNQHHIRDLFNKQCVMIRAQARLSNYNFRCLPNEIEILRVHAIYNVMDIILTYIIM